jgi:hypothetical protein
VCLCLPWITAYVVPKREHIQGSYIRTLIEIDMESETLVIIVRGIGMILLMVGGIASLLCGFHVYKRGTGAERDLAAFELGPMKLKANSVGSVVMATAVIWGWLGVSICPSIEKSGDHVHVYSFETPSKEVRVPSFETRAFVSGSSAYNDPNRLQDLFRVAVAEQPGCQSNLLTLDGKHARIDPNSITAVRDHSGHYLLSANVGYGSSWVRLTFEPSVVSGKAAFMPKRIVQTGESDPISSGD